MSEEDKLKNLLEDVLIALGGIDLTGSMGEAAATLDIICDRIRSTLDGDA